MPKPLAGPTQPPSFANPFSAAHETLPASGPSAGQPTRQGSLGDGTLNARRRASAQGAGDKRDSTGLLRRASQPQVAALSEPMKKQIEQSARAASEQPLTSLEAEIAASYVRPEHLKALGVATRLTGTAVSFRPAGAETLKRLGQGALPKPHDLLHKSIKPGTFAAIGGEDVEARMSVMRQHDLDGFVGHYTNGRLDGVYVDRKHPGMAELPLVADEQGKHHYLPINADNPGPDLVALHQVPDYVKGMYTGDYDTLHTINLAGNRGPQAQGEELRTVAALNCAVGAVDQGRPFGDARQAVVQHGSQYNYVAHMRNHEPDKPIDPRVAAASLPVAACVRGEWRLIRTPAELNAFNKEMGYAAKPGWEGEEGTRRPSIPGSGSGPSTPMGSRRASAVEGHGLRPEQMAGQLGGRRHSQPHVAPLPPLPAPPGRRGAIGGGAALPGLAPGGTRPAPVAHDAPGTDLPFEAPPPSFGNWGGFSPGSGALPAPARRPSMQRVEEEGPRGEAPRPLDADSLHPLLAMPPRHSPLPEGDDAP